jgi:DNA-binding SARP family transcriptional activator
MNTKKRVRISLYILGQTRLVWQAGGQEQELHIQPKPLHLLAFIALAWKSPHRREELQAQFWPEKPPHSAANNLRQALWYLRQTLPPETLSTPDDAVQWNPASPPWVDALAFEAALSAGDLDTALALYAGPLLPDAYEEWAQLERERLHLCYLTALEARSQRHYRARHWSAALTDVETLLAADPLNEAATRLAMACHWALDQREAARRMYDAYRQRVRCELQAEPLPETAALYQRILRGQPHPDQAPQPANAEIAAQTAHFSLLETLGAFRQGLEQATAWADRANGPALAASRRWQGRFYLRLGQLAKAHQALIAALALTEPTAIKGAVLADLATVETGMGNYEAAESHYAEALRILANEPSPHLRLLSSLGGLQGRLGHVVQARRTLEEAVRLAREQGNPASLAIAGGNLGILLIGQGEKQAAEATLQEALSAARRADAHWLTAHLIGHLGVLAQDREDLETAAQHYQRARALTETIGDQRNAILWTLNLGVVHYEQGQYAQALSLLTQGREQAAEQSCRNLEAGAAIFAGSCLVALGERGEGMSSIEEGLALAQEIGDQERILIGYLHRGRALIAMNQMAQARATLQKGVECARGSRMHRMVGYLRAELDNLSTLS